MLTLKVFSHFFSVWLFSSLAIILTFTTCANIPIAKPGCQPMCGNVTIYYPWGIGLDGKCSFSEFHKINCYNSTNSDPPRPLLNDTNIEVFDINITGQMRIRNIVAEEFFSLGKLVSAKSSVWASTHLNHLPAVFSDTENKLTLIGCDDFVFISGTLGRNYMGGCVAGCSIAEDVINGACSGIGCCQTSIPKGLRNLNVSVFSFTNHTYVSNFNTYNFAFVGEQDKFTFNVSDLNDPTFPNRTSETIPLVLDWFVGVDQTCLQAQRELSTYACQNNTICTDFDGAIGYRCSCPRGYEGNPYLAPGCVDIDECTTENNPCSDICINTPGGFKCTCPRRHHGDGLKEGSACTSNSSLFITKLILGLSIGLFFLVMSLSWMYFTMSKRKHLTKMKEKFFEQNGGPLLKEKLSQKVGAMETSKIFSTNELEAATNNYSEDCIVGTGGYGIVYKGILKDGREVAIKKSKVVDKSQVEHFINEVIILTQINHRNVVKLLGCCLETEVPLLVYQFISNGTLYEHIHRNRGISSWLTWTNCIRLASEAANALMYLHSAASTPIIHRDVKSTNILLDENYTAKISDFGASRLVPIDQDQVTTLVQGTMGYLDPEYFHTGKLTEKSDVYSFGVVLAELLTKEKPLCFQKEAEVRNLATYFIIAMKEDRLMEILDPQLVREGSEEQLLKLANLVKQCLNIKGEERPTMMEVALELEGLKKENRHPWANQNLETSNFAGQQDLYPIHPSSYDKENVRTIELSEQYSMEMSLISDMNHPR